MWKFVCDILKTHQGNTSGADSPFTPIDFWCHQVTILKKHNAWITLLGAFLIEHLGSWSLVWLCKSTHREIPVHPTSIVESLFDSRVYCQCWDMAKKHAGCEPGNWDLLAKTLLSSCESKNVSFSSPPGKTLWVFEKTHGYWISLHYCQYWLPAPDFTDETLCFDLLTTSSAHRTYRFIMFVGLCHSWHRDQPDHTTSFVETFSFFLVSTSNSGTLQGNMLNENLPVVDCWQKQWAHPVNPRMFHSEASYKNTLILNSLQFIFLM